jgi:predicted CXXCH cytochrome family protein
MKNPGHRWSGVLVILGILLLSQCSPYAGKSVLHFFFDGVPDADSTLAASEEPSGALTDSTGVGELAMSEPGGSVHYPYEGDACALCHDEQSLGTMVEPQPGLCYICHEDLGKTYTTLHGPVAGGYCTACHEPHRSKNEKLLRWTGEALCFYCHQEKRIKGLETHQGLEGMVCTDCHNPHGGEDRYIFQ